MNDKTKEFIDKAIKIHGDKYNYLNTKYVNSRTKVIVDCKIHGKFEITPNQHLSRESGCQICSKINKSQKSCDTKEEFIKKANEIHSDKYDYSNVDYEHNLKEVKIICKEHGEFLQTPKVHKRGHGCKKCAGRLVTNQTEFILKANEIHCNKYDYSKVIYIDTSSKIIITCNKHGEFEQKPNNHLQGKGCAKCFFELNGDLKRKPREEFIKEAILIHGNKFDYSKVEYKNTSEEVKIICKEHGEFLQTPTIHLSSVYGCQKCSGNYTLTKEEFIKKAIEIHGDIYNYTNVNYINNSIPVEIECKTHGLFLQIPSVHLKGHQCSKCAGELRGLKQIENNDFMNDAIRIWGDKYDYSKVDYQGSDAKVKIICKVHGEFEKTPGNHTHKTKPQGCLKCQTKKQHSKAQIDWLNFISKKENIIIQHAENDKEFIIPNTKYKADGYCQETNTIYEFHGDYWHGNPNVFDSNEINKTTKCTFGELYQKTLEKEENIKAMGFNLITIWENDWDKINKSIRILQKIYRKQRIM